jgi:WD40 repeat protein
VIDALSDSTDVTPHGRYLLTKGDLTLTLWNLETQKSLYTFPGSDFFNPVFSPDGTKAVMGLGAPTLVMLDAHTQRELYELTVEPAVDRVVFSPSGNLLYGAESNLDGELRDGVIQLWDVRTGKKLYNTKPYPYLAGAFSTDDTWLFIILGAYNRPIPFTVKTIDVRSGKELRTVAILSTCRVIWRR